MRRHTPDARESVQHLRAAAHHTVEAEAFEEPRIEFQRLAARAGLLQHFADPPPQRRGRKRLAQAIARPVLNAFHRRFRGVTIGQQQYLRVRIPVRDALQQAGAAGDLIFHQDGAGVGALDQVPAFFRIGGRQHPDALRRERGLNDVQTCGVPHDGHNSWDWLHVILSARARHCFRY